MIEKRYDTIWDFCDGSRTVLYMKKENVGDGDD